MKQTDDIPSEARPMKGGTFARLPDRTTWPMPGPELSRLSHRLRYGTDSSRVDRVVAASVIDAYTHMVLRHTQANRNYTSKHLRAALARYREHLHAGKDTADGQ